MPQIGITDLKHIKVGGAQLKSRDAKSQQDITHHIRELLRIQDPFWNRSISKPPRDKRGMFLEKKSQTGTRANSLQEDDETSQQ